MIDCPIQPAWEQHAPGGEYVGPAERARSVESLPRQWGYAKADNPTWLAARHCSPPARLRFLSTAIFDILNNNSQRRFRPAAVSGRKNGTTATERPKTMASAEAAERLGPLIRNQMTNHMGLDNLPKRCGCTKHPHGPNLPDDGTTHNPDQPCPFEKDNFPKGMLGTCCSLRGKAAAYELEALGESSLANRMYDDMTAEEAENFARELRDAANCLERAHAGKADKPKGAGWNGEWDKEKKDWVWQKYSTFEDALACIREAARWYEKVAGLGYGVHAWY
jgi:hypothetical protein